MTFSAQHCSMHTHPCTHTYGTQMGTVQALPLIIPLSCIASPSPRNTLCVHIRKAWRIYNSPLHASLRAVLIGEGGREIEESKRSRKERGSHQISTSVTTLTPSFNLIGDGKVNYFRSAQWQRLYYVKEAL